jgi:hypothetical protein
MRFLPDDPLVRWIVGLLVAVSIGAPVVWALVIMVTS